MNIMSDNFSEVSKMLDTLTFAQVRFKYGTGRSSTVVTTQRKILNYRKGVMTEIGDIEENVWMQVVEYLIERDGETALFNNLYAWVKETYKWNWKNEHSLKEYILELHSRRIFDDTKWVDYIAFNRQYRPEIITD